MKYPCAVCNLQIQDPVFESLNARRILHFLIRPSTTILLGVCRVLLWSSQRRARHTHSKTRGMPPFPQAPESIRLRRVRKRNFTRISSIHFDARRTGT